MAERLESSVSAAIMEAGRKLDMQAYFGTFPHYQEGLASPG